VATDGLVASVGGTVIDEDEFPMVAGDLGQFLGESPEKLGQDGFLVEEGDDEGNGWRSGVHGMS
jgi:hypothetical protein